MGTLIQSENQTKAIMRVFVLLSVLAVAYGVHLESADWEGFKLTYGKEYAYGTEDAHRLAYLKTIEEINNHNMEYAQGLHTYDLGINKYSDLTPEEWNARNGIKIDENTPEYVATYFGEGGSAPDSIDWRTMGAVNSIKNQGSCGSCWAFSAVNALEGAWQINKGQLNDAAEQQLVSCDSHSHGCNGGWPDLCYEYIKDNGANGIDTTASYPYTASDSPCDTQKTSDGQNVAATDSGPIRVAESDSALIDAVGNHGPVSICVQVNSKFSSYRSGIFDDPTCGHQINHAVAIVGYDKGQNLYHLRNSWGTSWGESGYMRIVMGKNTCGMLTRSVYPQI